tara:strand:- start:1786 stop:2280 length:495 start_codon:yes stop_codon:yes gene_type:complete
MKNMNNYFQKKVIFFISLITLFFGISDFTILPSLISNVLKTELGIVLFVLLGIFFILNDLYLFLIILIIISYKNTVLIEGAGEADDGLADEEAAAAKKKAAETKKKTKEAAKKEMAAVTGDIGKETGVDTESIKLNDGGEINSFGDLFGQAKRNAISLLNSLGN